MFRVAHLTDPHVGPLPRPRLRELLNKRLTGWVNWHRARQETHDMELLADLVVDIREQAPDHIICTGDLCNIGLPDEWPTSREFMETPFWSATLQVILGGVLVLLAGIFIGSA